MTNGATPLFFGMSCRIGLLVLLAAVASSGKLSSGACPTGRGGNPKKIWELGSRHVNSVQYCVIVNQTTKGTKQHV